ncbi:hypothetical protein [Pedobacter sp. GSP4]|uniref:hypothetical protein n=1 Tax=Pedobacter sp. GSP4 TaxID=3453716 RepID=UPI003F702B97
MGPLKEKQYQYELNLIGLKEPLNTHYGKKFCPGLNFFQLKTMCLREIAFPKGNILCMGR